MPFGLSGAPGNFQRLMDKGHESYSAAYLDDVIIYSGNWEAHIKHVAAVLQSLQEAGLTARHTKCQFGKAECIYLGHRVGQGKIIPERSKIEAVRDFAIPTTKKEVRIFLGLAGYYRRFVKNFSTLAAPLSDLVRRNRPNQVQWGSEHNEAFQRIKELLHEQPILRCPDFTKMFILQTDASERGIGVVLSQKDDDGTDYPLAYFSKKLLPREERYSTIEKECLAIKLGMQNFRVYLLGRPFEVQTDHRSLEWLDRLKTNKIAECLWLQPLQFLQRPLPL